MLFNSLEFVFVFLPIALGAVLIAGRINQTLAKLALLALSLVFYAVWRLDQTPLLLFSIIFNFVLAEAMLRLRERGWEKAAVATAIVGIVVDVILLGWFKYLNFLVDNVNAAFGTRIVMAHIALPLAISFFTFQKIAYLVDTLRGETRKTRFLDFAVFASFFPQLIAGPIVHYREVMPQIRARRFGHIIGRNMMVGLVMFAIGLFKKTVISDSLGAFVDPLFAAAQHHERFGLLTGWLAAATFTCQVYFDFSGYSDMAIGLGRMFGVKLPLNFHSPLRSPDIIEYWRRWHMTLQRFIVSYIFQPMSLPLNRWTGQLRLKPWPAFFISVGIPVVATFTTVGIWHGAGWTFVCFGLLHSAYILVNQTWRELSMRRRRRLRRAGVTLPDAGPMRVVARHVVTLAAIAFGNVLFRARTVSDAAGIWRGMIGADGISAGLAAHPITWVFATVLAIAIALIALAPNTQQILRRWQPALNWPEWATVDRPWFDYVWKPDAKGLGFAALALFLGVVFIERGRAVFIYFNF